MQKRTVSLWFEKLPRERPLYAYPVDALIQHQNNTDYAYCLNPDTEKMLRHRDMKFLGARAFYHAPQSHSADLKVNTHFIPMLACWGKYFHTYLRLARSRTGILFGLNHTPHFRPLNSRIKSIWDTQPPLANSDLQYISRITGRATDQNVSLQNGDARVRIGAQAYMATGKTSPMKGVSFRHFTYLNHQTDMSLRKFA